MNSQFLLKIRAVGGTLLAALILMLIPLPDWAGPWRPDWLAITLIYWVIAWPEHVGIGIAWILGLLVDVLFGTLLGQYALGFALLAFIAIRFHIRARNYPIYQQALFAGIALLPYMAILLWIQGIQGEDPKSWLYWAPVLTSMLMWPIVYKVLRAVRKAN
ncbi:MAG: rod shape-determining protein MreD [Gammaproteobacteria bacterium]|nr:rod shape-determining protein MreD [Gammaproteobacteria bacterium]